MPQASDEEIEGKDDSDTDDVGTDDIDIDDVDTGDTADVVEDVANENKGLTYKVLSFQTY